MASRVEPRAPGEPRQRVRAFAPGRVNLIGEHTDYNEGLALAFTIAQGVSVLAERAHAPHNNGDAGRMLAQALDFGERDEFSLADPEPASGWRAFVRGAVAELAEAGFPPPAAQLQIAGDVPRGGWRLLIGGARGVAVSGAVGARRRGSTRSARRGSPSCARGWRTSGRGRRRVCSTSSPRSTASRTRRCESTSARSRWSLPRCA